MCIRDRQVSVRAQVLHTHVGDLTITLQAPDGARVKLLSPAVGPAQTGGCPGDDVDATFTDGALTRPGCALTIPAITGQILPEQPLTSLAGHARNGTWMLEVTDSANGGYGALKTWSLDLACGLPTVSLRVVDGLAREGASDTAQLVVERSGGDLSQPLDVQLLLSGTATPDVDLGAFAALRTIPANVTSLEITVAATADNTPEPPESVIITLGGGRYLASGAPAVLQIVGAATTTTVTSSANPAFVGTEVTFTIQVSGAPAGLVEVMDGANRIAQLTLANGSAGFSTSTLSPGLHLLQVRYLGTTDIAPSEVIFTQVIDVETSTVLAATPSPATAGEQVTLTATVTHPQGLPDGHVTFMDGDVTLGVVDLTATTAVFTTSALTAGSHTLTAVHASTHNPVASTSLPITLTISAAATTTVLTAARDSVETGEPVGLLAVVTSAHGTPQGVVAFKEGDATLGFATLSNGSAALTATGLKLGGHSVTAVYQGSSEHSGSTSAAATITVKEPSAAPGCGCGASDVGTGQGWRALALLLMAGVVARKRQRYIR